MELLEENLTNTIIGAAIEVHRQLGPGPLESAYVSCLCYELDLEKIRFEREKRLPVKYKEMLINFNERVLKDGIRRMVL